MMAALRTPLVVVLGATGAGKSKLALEIAKVFKGEIISADSMQIYKGLDIITNKVTEEEQLECPHHMISYLEADHRHYNVKDFRDAALPIIEDLLTKRKLPVIVGGTNYYIESLLWNFLVDKRDTLARLPVHTIAFPELEPNTSGGHLEPVSIESPIPQYSPAPLKSAGPRDEKSTARCDISTIKRPRLMPGISHRLPGTQLDHSIICTSAADLSEHDCKENASVAHRPKSPVLNSVCDSALQQRPNHSKAASEMKSSSQPSINSEAVSLPSFSGNPNLSQCSEMHRLPDTDLNDHGVLNVNSNKFGLPSDVPEVTESLPEDESSPATIDPEHHKNNPTELIKCLHKMSPEDLYSRLQHVDPETAARQHPNNRRKIVRALQVYYQSGKPLSSILEEQHQGAQDVKSGPLRYPNPCILWVKCRTPELDRRLADRVDDMINRGLVKELEDFDEKARHLDKLKTESEEDTGHIYPHGFLQMIGFKEFHKYLQLTREERVTEQGRKLFEEGVQELKQATCRYAKQQVKWITKRFCSRPGPNMPAVYSVDSTDLSQWDQAVQEAIEVVRAFTQGETPAKEPEPATDTSGFHFARNVCDVCGGRIFLHQHEWESHIKSKKHKHFMKVAKEREKLSSVLSKREDQLREQEKAEQPSQKYMDCNEDGAEILEDPNSHSSQDSSHTRPSVLS